MICLGAERWEGNGNRERMKSTDSLSRSRAKIKKASSPKIIFRLTTTGLISISSYTPLLCPPADNDCMIQ